MITALLLASLFAIIAIVMLSTGQLEMGRWAILSANVYVAAVLVMGDQR